MTAGKIASFSDYATFSEVATDSEGVKTMAKKGTPVPGTSYKGNQNVNKGSGSKQSGTATKKIKK